MEPLQRISGTILTQRLPSKSLRPPSRPMLSGSSWAVHPPSKARGANNWFKGNSKQRGRGQPSSRRALTRVSGSGGHMSPGGRNRGWLLPGLFFVTQTCYCWIRQPQLWIVRMKRKYKHLWILSCRAKLLSALHIEWKQLKTQIKYSCSRKEKSSNLVHIKNSLPCKGISII